MSNEVEVVTSESGDWVIIKLNGEIIEEGHSIPANVVRLEIKQNTFK